MTKTAGQRQAEYRARRATAGETGNGERRLSTWVSTGTSLALARIARREGVTMRAVLERMILAEDGRNVAALELDTPEWDTYFGTK